VHDCPLGQGGVPASQPKLSERAPPGIQRSMPLHALLSEH
jgi:hypothetical protein